MQKPKRTRISFLVQKTNTLLKVYLCIIIALLGSFHLFGLNKMSMKGYVLTKEAQKTQELLKKIDLIDTQITRLETKDFLTRKSMISLMLMPSQREFLVIKDRYTAKK